MWRSTDAGLGEHGGQQVGSSRKAAGESGNKAERGKGAGGAEGAAEGPPRRPGELGARRLVPRGAKGDSGSYPVKDALWGQEAQPLTLALPRLDGAGE